ncbi:UDP-N-acetylglucosamine 2-epimerase [Winogradskyella aurantiaca]|uniref:UDP-N-acetylglucosamine 2-epimerase n=1 Tax=Winogradskyella aurantiaca TaxID=2219558 RepID=UPI000E1D70E6|nr:UDP-N-acetylglucosamine 2-epimerase [Winogradskyella aurantiaca]
MNKDRKRIVFLTGTRADFGKIKALIQSVEDQEDFDPFVFVTGMHMMTEYGYTLIEVERCGFSHIQKFENHTAEDTMDLSLARTIEGFSAYIKDIQPDLIVVHGDRVEALAGAIVGSLNNILVAHIEGGEVSGTIDELIRHSVSKLSHIHYTANEEAKERLKQMGELPESIYVIGSPDLDVMSSKSLPELDEVTSYYNIPFEDYALMLYHPVTTEVDRIERDAETIVQALIESGLNYVVVYPNNDLGSIKILKAYEAFKQHPKFKVFPSLRFEYFLILLKNAQFIIGNSSAGVREAPFYGVPSINVGSRQKNRSLLESILNVSHNKSKIISAINAQKDKSFLPDAYFGHGNSKVLFMTSLNSTRLWETPHQKQFQTV